MLRLAQNSAAVLYLKSTSDHRKLTSNHLTLTSKLTAIPVLGS